MEFGLTEALPIYSGGLGILAGDFLKAASDLGVHVVGIGLLWQQGYFRQTLSVHGDQIEFFPITIRTAAITPLRDAEGEWVTVTLQFPRRPVHLRVWQVAPAGWTSICWTRTTSRTVRPTVVSPASCMEVDPRCASSRR